MSEPSQSAQIFERLRAEILGLDRVPGARLTERGLEGEFGASRTPVRSALMRLESESLVQRNGRNWQISPIDLGEISGLSELREAVETEAVRLTVERASDEDIAAVLDMTSALSSATNEDGVRAGSEFHHELAALSGNPFLVATLESAMTKLARTRWLEIRTPDAREQAWQEHLEIARLVSLRDADGASALVRSHIVGTHERLRASLAADQRLLRAHGLAIVST